MKINLGLHLGFAATRYNEPKIWTDIVRNELKIRHIQFVSDLIEPSLPNEIIKYKISELKYYLKKNDIIIKHSITSSRKNYLGHYDKRIRSYWFNWLKKFIDISSKLGVEGVGTMPGILTFNDLNNNYKPRMLNIISGWNELSKYAKTKKIKYLFWEPMSVKRELGDTIKSTIKINKILNEKSKIPILLNLDVDHGNHLTSNPDDFNPYKWLEKLGNYSPCIHLKQKTKDIYSHKPFIKIYNKKGIIKPKKILSVIKKLKLKEITMYFEFSFREREPYDSRAIKDIKESIEYWRKYLDE